MGTRSIIAKPDGDAWRGRYCHWDGYPEGVGQRLMELVNRDGLAKVIDTIIDTHCGWSSIHMPDNRQLGAGYTDGRFLLVPEYGVAYNHNSDQGSMSDWHTPDMLGDTWCQWVYVLTPMGIMFGDIAQAETGKFTLVPYDRTDLMVEPDDDPDPEDDDDMEEI